MNAVKEGKVLAICISLEKGTPKKEIDEAKFKIDHGIVGDAHAGNWHRQVSLLSNERIEGFKESRKEISKDIDVNKIIVPGIFGENLVVSGIDPATLPIGTKLQFNEVVLELTQIGKECHSGCVISQITGQCIMPVYGTFSKVIKEGTIRKGDTFTIISESES